MKLSFFFSLFSPSWAYTGFDGGRCGRRVYGPIWSIVKEPSIVGDNHLMTFRVYLVLFILALLPPILIAQFQPAPGYLDSDYYYAGGIQLVNGKGFTEPYMWNYL